MNEIKLFINNISSDIYIGTSAGRKLDEDINNAKKSVKIISPYLSASYVQKLIKLKKNGLDVSLITADKIEDYSDNKNKSSIIQQHQTIIDSAKAKRDFLLRCEKWLLVLLMIVPVLLLINSYFKLNIENLKLIYFSIIYLLIILILHLIINKIRIYKYDYDTLFPIKIFLQPDKKKYGNNNYGYFIHSKIYIIDDEIAYFGSLNFTVNGFESNMETRFRTTDDKVIQEVTKFYYSLFDSNENNELNIVEMAKNIYVERIN